MDVTKTPPLGAPLAQAPGARAPETGSQSAATVAASADRANIRPLDVLAALRILIAEVRSSFELTAPSPVSDADILVDSPAQAAGAVLQVFLQAIPQDAPSLPAWTEAVAQTEAALQSGLEQGVVAVAAWRDVSTIVVDAAKETQALISSALSDDARNPAWLRPEWAGFAPRLQRFWRRRRLARRRLTDPDYPEGNVDDDHA
jgi:hypothetical protein